MELKDRRALLADWIRRVTAYTDEVTYFGANSVMRALGEATAGLASTSHRLYAGLIRRWTLSAAAGATLTEVAAEHGAERLGAARARALVVFSPWSVNVLGIRTVGLDDYVEIDDGTPFDPADNVRVRNGDGTVTEVAVVASISAGTGLVAGGDELVITGGLANAYTPGTDDVDVLLRATLVEGTQVRSTDGPVFELLSTVVLGDANPVLAGEGTALSLADKAWAEAVERGAAGNVGAETLTALVTPNAKVRALTNPEPARYGADEEGDADLRYRAAHGPAQLNQETEAWAEALIQAANVDGLRAVRNATFDVRTMELQVVSRSLAPFSSTDLAALNAWLAARVRGAQVIACYNATLTSVEVEAEVTLTPNATLRDAWVDAANRLANLIDTRSWAWGEDVDDADLLSVVNEAAGIADVDTATFLPAGNVVVGPLSLPTLTRLSLRDRLTGETINASLAQGW